VGEELAGANVNRSYSLSASNIAVFSFLLFFLYPRFEKGTINPSLFQCVLVVMGVATFSLVFASFHYYRASLARTAEAERAILSRRADRFWLIGYTLMFLVPSLVLFLVGLVAVAWVWLALWLAYVLLVIRSFPRVQTPRSG
jgi:hypothetical protein